MPGIPKPREDELPAGPRRHEHWLLVGELHVLYRRCGAPGVAQISRSVTTNEELPDSISPQGVSDMLHGKSVPRWSKLEVVVTALASMVRLHPLPDPAGEVLRFHELWAAANGASEAEGPERTLISAHHPPTFIAVQNTSVSGLVAVNDRFAVAPPMTRTSCLPIYLVVGVGQGGVADTQGVIDGLRLIHSRIALSPRFSETAHLSILVCSKPPRVQLELTWMDSLVELPDMTFTGDLDYAAGFETLNERISRDLPALRNLGLAVLRPVVIVAATDPPADEGWREAFERLVNPRSRYRVHVIGVGVDASADFIRSISTRGFQITDNAMEWVVEIDNAFDDLVTSVSAASVQTLWQLDVE